MPVDAACQWKVEFMELTGHQARPVARAGRENAPEPQTSDSDLLEKHTIPRSLERMSEPHFLVDDDSLIITNEQVGRPLCTTRDKLAGQQGKVETKSAHYIRYDARPTGGLRPAGGLDEF